MFGTLYAYASDLFSLVFPRACPLCERILLPAEPSLCTPCWAGLPERPCMQGADPLVMDKLYGRLPLAGGWALYHFLKSGSVQRLIHQIKYKADPSLPTHLGRYLSYRMRGQDLLNDLEALVPVPLHAHRQAQRGYNQSERLAQGLAEGLALPLVESLVRRLHTPSQTQRSRVERWTNVQGAFKLAKPEQVVGKHCLLVDDVLTTGATLEACGEVLLQGGVRRLSVAVLAVADH